MTQTATKNVFILHENFYFPTLDRHRRLWLYLPPDYDKDDTRYPVIYMHDGQNLFDELNSFGAEWGVDETLDSERGKIIVIGIDNGQEHRMAEYMLHDHPDHGSAQGDAYLKDIAQTLKPFVDDVLRTKPEREHTCIAGSSMGGLISFYAGIYLPELFGVVGIFSPAFWLDAPAIFKEVKTVADKNEKNLNDSQRWYFYAGAQESETMVSEVATMVTIMRNCNYTDVTYQIDADGIHDEAVWKNYFPGFYKWIVGEKSSIEMETESDVKI